MHTRWLHLLLYESIGGESRNLASNDKIKEMNLIKILWPFSGARITIEIWEDF